MKRHVVVIGGGASAKGKGWGRRIDEADHVIKMFDHLEWQTPADYGLRADVGFFLVNRGPAFEYWNGHPDSVEWWGGILHSEHCDLVTIFRKRAWFDIYAAWHLPILGKKLMKDPPKKYIPARGIVAVSAALARLEPSDLTLVGFDHIAYGKISPSAHKTEVLNLGKRSLGSWDVQVDKNLLRHLVDEANVRLHIAVGEWPHG